MVFIRSTLPEAQRVRPGGLAAELHLTLPHVVADQYTTGLAVHLTAQPHGETL
jgi:hypothetical protein